jgi:hypothetical protein
MSRSTRIFLLSLVPAKRALSVRIRVKPAVSTSLGEGEGDEGGKVGMGRGVEVLMKDMKGEQEWGIGKDGGNVR